MKSAVDAVPRVGCNDAWDALSRLLWTSEAKADSTLPRMLAVSDKLMRAWQAVLLASLAALPVAAHELEATRLTLVARADRHLTLALHVDYVELLRRVLAPQQSGYEFALRCATLPEAEWRREQARAQAKLEAGIRVGLPGGGEARLRGWQWPAAERVQDLLRQRAMAALVDPGHHAEDPQDEIRAEATAEASMEDLNLRLPAELRPLLVVSYRPAHTWVSADRDTVPIRFR